jgi:hypothetical protein
MPTERDSNGVAVRMDGKGDAWSDKHRQLGVSFNMNDIDGLMGLVAFAANTSDHIFMEYVPDTYEHRHNIIRRFYTVALFDRKTSRNYAFSDANRVSLAWYLDLCRRLAKTQPRPPKYFFVIGQDTPPWQMIELDIDTGKIMSEHTLPENNWRTLWDIIGLSRLRQELRQAIEKPTP